MASKEFQIDGGTSSLPYVECYLPADPSVVKKERIRGTSIRTLAEWNRSFFSADVDGGPDALIYLHNAVGNFALLSLEMASYSPIEPSPIRLGPGEGAPKIMRVNRSLG